MTKYRVSGTRQGNRFQAPVTVAGNDVQRFRTEEEVDRDMFPDKDEVAERKFLEQVGDDADEFEVEEVERWDQ